MAKSKNILLIEDDPEDRRWYGNRLQEAGYEVAVVSGWGRTLYKIDAIQPDLIVTELVAPHRDEIMTLFKLLLYNHTGLPVVIHTAPQDDFTSSGAQAYVRKTSDCERLIKEVDRVFATEYPSQRTEDQGNRTHLRNNSDSYMT